MYFKCIVYLFFCLSDWRDVSVTPTKSQVCIVYMTHSQHFHSYENKTRAEKCQNIPFNIALQPSKMDCPLQ